MYNELRKKSFSLLNNSIMNVSRQVEVMDIETGGQTFELNQILINIPCHITINAHDIPNPATVGIIPIAQTIKLRFDNGIKLESGDIVECKKLDGDNVLCCYSGIINQPNYSSIRGTVYLLINEGN